MVYRNHQPEFICGLKVSFINVGDLELEFCRTSTAVPWAPWTTATPGAPAITMGAICRYIGNRGPGLDHTGLKIRDINGLLSRLESRGLTLVDKVARPGGRRSQIGFIHPTSLGGWLSTWSRERRFPGGISASEGVRQLSLARERQARRSSFISARMGVPPHPDSLPDREGICRTPSKISGCYDSGGPVDLDPVWQEQVSLCVTYWIDGVA